jgi:hypothetical protein
MSLIVPIQNVKNPRHVEIYAQEFTNKPVRMEVYTGVVVISANVRQLEPLGDQVLSFVPLPDNIDDGKRIYTVREYEKDLPPRWTAIAYVSSSTDYDDERNIVALDQVNVDVEYQPKVEGILPFHALVLRADVAAGFAILHHITYQITILSEVQREPQTPQHPNGLTINLKELNLPYNARPKD